MNIKLSVYDVMGRLVDIVSEGTKAAGNHTFTWNATNLASGMYLLRLETEGQVMVRKMALLK
jgi:flagellar hook assembly protein FlgD